MNNEELNQKFRVYEQQIRQIQEQLQAIEQAILDMNQINLGLDEIPKNKDSEILAPIGRGIFVSAKVVSEELTVDVGEGTYVKKSIPETKEIILEQIEKLNLMKDDLEMELEKINEEITLIMQESQEAGLLEEESEVPHEDKHSHKDGKKCSCKEGEECEDEENCDCGHKH